MRKKSHVWHFQFSSRALKQLADLRPPDRLGVFRSIAELLKAEDPTRIPGVKAVKSQRADHIWRHRYGHWRIFFTHDNVSVVHLDFTYKGTLFIIAIERDHEGY